MKFMNLSVINQRFGNSCDGVATALRLGLLALAGLFVVSAFSPLDISGAEARSFEPESLYPSADALRPRRAIRLITLIP